MYQLEIIFPLILLPLNILAVPTLVSTRVSNNSTYSARCIAKRAMPQIDKAIPQKNRLQLLGKAAGLPGSLDDALLLMHFGVLCGRPDVFAKHFDAQDRPEVLKVFRRLLGKDNISGAPELANIHIKLCTENQPKSVIAELEFWRTEYPILRLCKAAWKEPDMYTAGGQDPCKGWDDIGMHEEMMMLGSTLVHEYVHWHWFLKGVSEHIGDYTYGPWNVRRLDKRAALYNADSYAWFATENYWAMVCDKDRGWDIK